VRGDGASEQRRDYEESGGSLLAVAERLRARTTEP
jgi:hypothetical protein